MRHTLVKLLEPIVYNGMENFNYEQELPATHFEAGEFYQEEVWLVNGKELVKAGAELKSFEFNEDYAFYSDELIEV